MKYTELVNLALQSHVTIETKPSGSSNISHLAKKSDNSFLNNRSYLTNYIVYWNQLTKVEQTDTIQFRNVQNL